MGRHFIKEGDGHYREYSEEEYEKLEMNSCLIKIFFIVVGIIIFYNLEKNASSVSEENNEVKENNVEMTDNPPVETYRNYKDVLFESDVESDATNTIEESERQDVVTNDTVDSLSECNEEEELHSAEYN